MRDVEALIAEAREAQREHSPDEWIIEELADALEGLVSAPTGDEIDCDAAEMRGGKGFSVEGHKAGIAAVVSTLRIPVVPVSGDGAMGADDPRFAAAVEAMSQTEKMHPRATLDALLWAALPHLTSPVSASTSDDMKAGTA